MFSVDTNLLFDCPSCSKGRLEVTNETTSVFFIKRMDRKVYQCTHCKKKFIPQMDI